MLQLSSSRRHPYNPLTLLHDMSGFNSVELLGPGKKISHHAMVLIRCEWARRRTTYDVWLPRSCLESKHHTQWTLIVQWRDNYSIIMPALSLLSILTSCNCMRIQARECEAKSKLESEYDVLYEWVQWDTFPSISGVSGQVRYQWAPTDQNNNIDALN